ncbi:hypothetical protein GCM10011571_18590 [Marinithermofilum abyssi]|uniref:YheC/D like ATP-grasp n=1 Tax=Marinithermofilum abyssi TaxID=1571185 RepID=A0A8J2VF67_9BACL|nr:YheC/YheD family protein [Marinithermofilum abyssi]GGE17180.1 hypothetical protein GCM10011571_18590 [Marinithermofilum abyssi]
MSYPKAGWIALQKGANSLVFIPHPRSKPRSDYPGALRVLLGHRLLKTLPVQTPAIPVSSPRLLPTRLIEWKEGTYKAGPFIAILTSKGNGSTFCGNRQNFIDIIRMGKRMGVTVFVLTPEGLQPDSRTVRGYMLDTRKGGKGWISGTLPFPDVVYNRIPSRFAEQQQAEQDAIRLLTKMENVHLFNPGFFDKWTLYLYLKRSAELCDLLPETVQWGNREAFFQLLQRHSILYLKPIDGKAGHGMIRVTKQDQHFETIYQTLKQKQRFLSQTREELYRLLQTLIQSRKYVLQQGIPLARYLGSPFDLRLLLQKDGTGTWQITGKGIRLAGQKAISTHVPMGGSIEDAEVVLGYLFSERQAEKMEKLENTAIRIARHIEEQQGHTLGEMSMDMGIDNQEKLWFFEANAKPMKFDEPDIRERSLQQLIQYCLYLSGFSRAAAQERG